MIRKCLRAAAAVLTMCCWLMLAGPWQKAQAAPVVFQNVTHHASDDEPARFTAVLMQGSGSSQALVQLFTAGDPGARISALYVQDATGVLARDAITGDPLVRLSQTRIHEVLLADAGVNKIAVIKTLSTALAISLSDAKRLVDRAPVVIRTASTPDGNEQLQRQLQDAGARVTLSSHPDPAAPVGANVGVTTPGGTPTGYDVVLERAGANKVALIKLVRELTGLSITDAKKLVDSAPSVIEANASRAEALAMQQALQGIGATVALKPIGTGTAGHGPIVLPPGGTGIVPDIEVSFSYLDPDATPSLQLALDLDAGWADLLAAWQKGRFLLGLEVTDAAGVADLYLASRAPLPAEVPEPSTAALLLLAVLGLRLGQRKTKVPGGVRGTIAAPCSRC